MVGSGCPRTGRYDRDVTGCAVRLTRSDDTAVRRADDDLSAAGRRDDRRRRSPGPAWSTAIPTPGLLLLAGAGRAEGVPGVRTAAPRRRAGPYHHRTRGLSRRSSRRPIRATHRWLTSRQALHHATVQSARAVGLGDGIGRIAPEWRADLVLVDLSGPHTPPVHDLHDLAATLAHSARASDVRTTIVDGRVLMRDREPLTADVPAVVRELAERLPAPEKISAPQR
ncbi:amidohydrolase family protein [Streptomyces griseosporeus]|uniref:amidohydrolase family protein n=1 Tax=Streptomyces griseosporeus TaxID=1910 RepID=UPI0036C0F483